MADVLKRKATASSSEINVRSQLENDKKLKPSKPKNTEELYDELFGSPSSSHGFSPSGKFLSSATLLSSQVPHSSDEPIDDLFVEFQHVPAPHGEGTSYAPLAINSLPESAPLQTITTQEPLLSTPTSSHHTTASKTTTHFPNLVLFRSLLKICLTRCIGPLPQPESNDD